MVTKTMEYKGSKFECGSCGYIVSSDATSDFDVEDFSFCPYCGFDNRNRRIDKTQLTLRTIAFEVMNDNENRSDDFYEGIEAYEVALENKIRELEKERNNE